MVTEQVLNSIIPVVAAVIGYLVAGAVNLRSTDKQIASQRQQMETRLAAQKEQLDERLSRETNRRKGEFFLEKKVDALIDFYSVMNNTRTEYKRTIDQAEMGAMITEDRLTEIVHLYREFRSEMDQALIFLDQEQQEPFRDLSNELYRTNQEIDSVVNPPMESVETNFRWHEVVEKFDQAEKILRNEVKGPIDEMGQGSE